MEQASPGSTNSSQLATTASSSARSRSILFTLQLRRLSVLFRVEGVSSQFQSIGHLKGLHHSGNTTLNRDFGDVSLIDDFPIVEAPTNQALDATQYNDSFPTGTHVRHPPINLFSPRSLARELERPARFGPILVKPCRNGHSKGPEIF